METCTARGFEFEMKTEFRFSRIIRLTSGGGSGGGGSPSLTRMNEGRYAWLSAKAHPASISVTPATIAISTNFGRISWNFETAPVGTSRAHSPAKVQQLGGRRSQECRLAKT